MNKMTRAFVYLTALGSSGWWWCQHMLDALTPPQWNAIGVIGGLAFTFLTWLTNLIFKIRADRRQAGTGRHERQ